MPSTCLAYALAAAADNFDTEQLLRMVRSPIAAVLPLGAPAGADGGPDQADEIHRVAKQAAKVDKDVTVGHAVAEALSHKAYYATIQPGRVAEALPKSWTILDVSL